MCASGRRRRYRRARRRRRSTAILRCGYIRSFRSCVRLRGRTDTAHFRFRDRHCRTWLITSRISESITRSFRSKMNIGRCCDCTILISTSDICWVEVWQSSLTRRGRGWPRSVVSPTATVRRRDATESGRCCGRIWLARIRCCFWGAGSYISGSGASSSRGRRWRAFC